MNQSQFNEILNQYEFGNKDGNGYALFEKYKDWFVENGKNGNLKLALEEMLAEISHNIDLRKYDFILLITQAFGIDFSKEDKHFEFLFSTADSILEDFHTSVNGGDTSWLLHQLMDICIHYADEVKSVIERNPALVPGVLKKIGKVVYKPIEYGPQMYFAAYKALWIFRFLPKEVAKELLEKVYLKHVDKRVVDDAEELVEHLKEEGRYD